MLFAWGELGRSKVRFFGLIVMAGALVFVLLFLQALTAAVLDGMAGAIKQQSAPVVVFTKESKRALGGGLVKPELAQKIASVPGVGDTGKLGVGLMSFDNPKGGPPVNVSVIGYEVGKPGMPNQLTEGRQPNADDEIVASSEGSLGKYKVGDTLMFQPGAVPLKVVGLTQNALLNIGPALWFPWPSFEKVQKLTTTLPVVDPAVLAVMPRDGTGVPQLMKDIDAQVQGVDAVTREQAADSAPGRPAIAGAFFSVMLLCYAVVGIVIGFFFLTMTLQKESSITLLRAVGANARYLISCLLLEVAVVIFGGMVVGVLLLYLVKPLVAVSIIIQPAPGGILATAIPALIVALLGAIPPIRRVLRADPFNVVSRPSLGGTG
jgi:putative ABC transport system permease protein